MTVFRHRQGLVQACREGLRPKYLFFWGHKPRGQSIDKSCLSQWFPAAFEVRSERFVTAEHWMMAEKASLFGDQEMRARIIASRSPGEAKKLGRQVRGFDASVWDDHSLDIVTKGNVHKFGQNEHLRSFLLATSHRVLVEASPRDRIWGIGMDQNNPHATNPEMWRGENKLGFALMLAREELTGSM